MTPWVITSDADCGGGSAALCQRWGFTPGPPPESGLYLQLSAERLELREAGSSSGPLYVDFVSGALGHRRRYGRGRGEPIARAVGLARLSQPTILDTTAGLGRDAFILASLGCRVDMVERSVVLAALLEDGLRRGEQGDGELAAIVARMSLCHSDAQDRLGQITVGDYDVIYIDPMFPPRRKRALVKKEMQYLQKLLQPQPGETGEGATLLGAAMEKAGRRVVVKRPVTGEPLGGVRPTQSTTGKSHRFDIYLTGLGSARD